MSLKSYTTGEWTALFTLYSRHDADFPHPGESKVFTTYYTLLMLIQEGFPWTGDVSEPYRRICRRDHTVLGGMRHGEKGDRLDWIVGRSGNDARAFCEGG